MHIFVRRCATSWYKEYDRPKDILLFLYRSKDLRNRFSLEVEHEAFNLRVVGSIPTIGSCLAKASPFSSHGRASLL